jgi:hypothetical protein
MLDRDMSLRDRLQPDDEIGPTYYVHPGILDYFTDCLTALWRISWVYRSNWRVLHVDGFEGGSRLPERQGRMLQLYSSADTLQMVRHNLP